MSSKSCPHCGEQFESAGAARDHAWDTHQGCHYCGEQLDSPTDKTELYKHWLMSHPEDLRKVDQKQAESAVDSVTFSDRASNQGLGAAVSGLPRRYFLLAGGATATAGVVGAGALLTSQSGGVLGNDANPVDEYEYARIGPDDATATITYFGSYKCPHCARFNATQFKELLAEYVEPGDLAITYRNLSYLRGDPFLGSDAPNPGHAGLAVYNNEPDVYLDYHDYLFENQSSVQRWSADELADAAREVGVSDPEMVRTAVEERHYVNALEETDAAAQNAGVTGTPQLLIDGTVATPGQDSYRPLIDSLISDS